MSDYGSTPPPDPNDPSRRSPDYGPPAGQGQQPSYGQQPDYGSYGGQGGYYAQPSATPPNNYLVPAILTTLFCCLPFGVASIVFAAQVNSKHAAGDFAGAQEASAKAKKFAVIAAVAGVIVGVLYVVFFFLVGKAAMQGQTY